jgi:sRNA-binding regulator protein Hfq
MLHNQTHTQIREEQLQAGREMGDVADVVIRRPVITRSGSTRHAVGKSAKAITSKGHEAFLKALESSGTTVEFVMASSGASIIGVVKTSDKYTISVMVATGIGEEYRTHVLFKHDISEFIAMTLRPVELH